MCATLNVLHCYLGCVSQVLIVQSNAHNAPYLERRIEAFLYVWQRELDAMTDEDFSKQVPWALPQAQATLWVAGQE